MILDWKDFNFGTYANVGDADDLKTAFMKTDNNLNYLKERLTSFGNTIESGNTILILDGYNVKLKTIETDNPQTATIRVTSDSIFIDVKDSSVSDDLAPTLSGNLNTNDNEIYNKDENDEYKNLKLNELFVSTTDGYTELYSVNPISIASDGILKFKSNIDADGKSIQCSEINSTIITATNITVGNLINGNLHGNVTGTFDGTTTGIHTGNVFGNVTGTVNSISNHSITNLNDVLDTLPTEINQLLAWDGSHYVPTTIHQITATSPLRLPQLTYEQINLLTPVEGDMIYNISIKKFQGYADGDWVDLH